MEPLAIPYQDNATVLLVIVEIRVRRLAKRVPMETDASRFVYAKMVQSAIQLMALVTALKIGQENTAMKRRRVAPNGSSCLVASVPHATAIRTMLSVVMHMANAFAMLDGHHQIAQSVRKLLNRLVGIIFSL